MHHHRRVWWLVVQARIAALGPCKKGPIHLHPQLGHPHVGLRPGRSGRLQSESTQLRPRVGECSPFVVPRIGAGNRSTDRAHQAFDPARLVALGIVSDPHRHPFVAKYIARLVRHGGEHSLEEEIVDIDADIVVIEGEVRRPFKLEAGRSAPSPRVAIGVLRKAIEKQRPAFLQERKEGIPIGHDGIEGPGFESAATPEQVNQALLQDAR